jgi:hypothetical protein
MGVEALRFLVGRWRGEGTVRADRVTADVAASAEPDGSIAIDHVTHRPGAEDHRERIVLRDHRGRTSAFIRSGSGPEQRFQLVPSPAGWRFTRADPRAGFMTWEIERQGDGAIAERFSLGEGAAAETVVSLRHVRA